MKMEELGIINHDEVYIVFFFFFIFKFGRLLSLILIADVHAQLTSMLVSLSDFFFEFVFNICYY